MLIDLSICSCFVYIYSQKHELAALVLVINFSTLYSCHMPIIILLCYALYYKRERTALMLAARDGHTETVKVLIAAGANVNITVSVQCSLHFEFIFYYYRCSFSLRM